MLKSVSTFFANTQCTTESDRDPVKHLTNDAKWRTESHFYTSQSNSLLLPATQKKKWICTNLRNSLWKTEIRPRTENFHPCFSLYLHCPHLPVLAVIHRLYIVKNTLLGGQFSDQSHRMSNKYIMLQTCKKKKDASISLNWIKFTGVVPVHLHVCIISPMTTSPFLTDTVSP